MWKSSGLSTLLVTNGPKCMFCLPFCCGSCRNTVNMVLQRWCVLYQLGSVSALPPAAWCKPVALSAEPLGSFLLFALVVELSKELWWGEVHGVGFALLHTHHWVLQRFWSNSKFAAAQSLYQGKARCMQSMLKCPLMKWGLTFCDIKKKTNPEFNISWEIIFHNLMPGALFFLIWGSEFWSLSWFA